MSTNNNSEDTISSLIKTLGDYPQTTLGIKDVILLDEKLGKAILCYNATNNMCHSGGIVQGGFITGWLDAAMAYACMAYVGKDALVLSLSINIIFLNSVGPGSVISEGRVVRVGKSVAFLEGELKDKNGKILASGTQTAKLRRNFYK